MVRWLRYRRQVVGRAGGEGDGGPSLAGLGGFCRVEVTLKGDSSVTWGRV